MRRRPVSMKHQQGAALYVALIFLVLLSLLGIVGMQVAVLQERMAANYRATNIAFQLAEGTGRSKEIEITTAFSDAGPGSYVADKELCDTGATDFNPAQWAAAISELDNVDTRSRSLRIDKCMVGGSSLVVGTGPENERLDQIYLITAFANDNAAAPTSDSAVDTTFVPY